MLMPSIIIVVFITIYVIINTLKESLGIIPELFLNKLTFNYYIELINNHIFFKSLIYSFYIALVSTILSTIAGTYLGYAISKSKGIFFNIIYRFPILLSYIAAASLIYSTYSDKGFLYHIFLILGIKIDFNIIYNASGIAVILLNMFKGIPFIAFSVCPIFMKTEASYKETAKNLGCSNIMYIIKVLLPMSKQSIITSFLIIFNYNLFTYEGFYFLGPSNPVSIGILAYQTYINPDMTSRALGMSINMVMIILSLILCTLYYNIIKNNYHNKIEDTVNEYESIE